MGGACKLERQLDKGNKNLQNILFESSNFNPKNYYEYKDKKLSHNELSWRYAFNFFFDICYNKLN